MDLRPMVLSLILLPVVALNVWLSIEGMEGDGFIVWGMFTAMLVWANDIWVFIEIFMELKRRRNESIL